MTRKGFKAVLVRQEAHKLASKQAELEETSIADIATRAILRYINRKSEVEEELRSLMKVYEEYKLKQLSSK